MGTQPAAPSTSTCNPSISRMETKSPAITPAETLSFQFSEMLLNAHLGARICTWAHASALGHTHLHLGTCICTWAHASTLMCMYQTNNTHTHIDTHSNITHNQIVTTTQRSSGQLQVLWRVVTIIDSKWDPAVEKHIGEETGAI